MVSPISRGALKHNIRYAIIPDNFSNQGRIMNLDTILLYTTVAFFYITSPGPAVLLAVVNGLRSDMKVVSAAALGNVLGLAILSTASILGLGAIIKTSALLFMIVKFIGAFYLIYLGYKFLINRGGLNFDNTKTYINRSTFSYFKEALLIAVTNPKPIIFFTAIFPQFIDINRGIAVQFFIMTAIFLIISFMSLCLYGFLAKRSKRLLQKGSVMIWISRLTGGLFISIGIALMNLKQRAS